MGIFFLIIAMFVACLSGRMFQKGGYGWAPEGLLLMAVLLGFLSHAMVKDPQWMKATPRVEEIKQ